MMLLKKKMDSISLGSHIFSSSPDWVRSSARTKNVQLFLRRGRPEVLHQEGTFWRLCTLSVEVGLSLKEEKKVCRPSPHTKLGKKTSSCRKIGMSEVLSLSLLQGLHLTLCLHYTTKQQLICFWFSCSGN